MELQTALRRSLDEAAAAGQAEGASGQVACSSGEAPAAKQQSEQRRKRQCLPSELSTVVDLCGEEESSSARQSQDVVPPPCEVMLSPHSRQARGARQARQLQQVAAAAGATVGADDATASEQSGRECGPPNAEHGSWHCTRCS